MDLVSIIIPVYNGETYLSRAVESCLAQDYPNVQIIIVDNASTDNTSKICENFASMANVSILYCAEKGVANARNKGINYASGRYICFLDSDDELLENSLSKRIHALRETNNVVVSTAYLRRSNDGDKLIQRDRVEVKDFYRCNPIGNLTGLYDTHKIEKLLQEPIHHEDYLMWWNLYDKSAGHHIYLPEITAIYHVTEGSLSSAYFQNLIGHGKILNRRVSIYNPKFWWFLILYIVNGLQKRMFI